MENQDIFLDAGGARYEYIPCLNAEEGHLAALTDLINDELSSWLDTEPDPQRTHQLAEKLGAQR